MESVLNSLNPAALISSPASVVRPDRLNRGEAAAAGGIAEASGINKTGIFNNFAANMLARLETRGSASDSVDAQGLVNSIMNSLENIRREFGDVAAYGAMAGVLEKTADYVSADGIAGGFQEALQNIKNQTTDSGNDQKIDRLLAGINESGEAQTGGTTGLSQALNAFFGLEAGTGRAKTYNADLLWSTDDQIQEKFVSETMAQVQANIENGVNNSSRVLRPKTITPDNYREPFRPQPGAVDWIASGVIKVGRQVTQEDFDAVKQNFMKANIPKF